MLNLSVDFGVLYPAAVMALWTLTLYFILGFLRTRAIGRREIHPNYFRAYVGEEPERLRVVSRHVVNQFEMPMLFHVICIIVFVTGLSSDAMLILAWSYVGLRLLHSAIHLTFNNVLYRFRVFILSWLVLIAMWVLWLYQAIQLN